MRSFCSLRLKTEAAEGTRSGESHRRFLIGQKALARLQLVPASFRSGYSWRCSSFVRIVAGFIGRLFVSVRPSHLDVGCRQASVLQEAGDQRCGSNSSMRLAG